MKYGKRAGIAIFSILLAISILSSFYINTFSIGDTDPSTYVAVPLLMLPLFALFMLKEKMEPKVAKRDILFGILVFVLLAVLTIFLRFWLSYLFLSYRIDMLIFPLAIISFALLLFGSSNLPKFKYIAIYSMLASSLIAAPLIMANQPFTQFNTAVIYSMLAVLIHGINFIPPGTIATSGYQISIGQTCVGIGILLSIVLFLVPLAYLYNGSMKAKSLWVFSGFVLLFILNIARMFSIALLWLLYGPTGALMEVHVFAGVILFYIAIIVIVLLAGKYGLELNAIKKHAKKPSAQAADMRQADYGYYKIGIILGILLAIAYFAMTYYYSAALYISQVHLHASSYPPLTTAGAYKMAGSILNYSGISANLLLNSNSSETVLIHGLGVNSSMPLLAYMSYNRSQSPSHLFASNKILGSLSVSGKNGVSGTLYYVESNDTGFIVYHSIVPYTYSGGFSALDISIYLILPSIYITTLPHCGGGFSASDYLLNMGNPSLYNGTIRESLISGHCLFEKVLS